MPHTPVTLALGWLILSCLVTYAALRVAWLLAAPAQDSTTPEEDAHADDAIIRAWLDLEGEVAGPWSASPLSEREELESSYPAAYLGEPIPSEPRPFHADILSAEGWAAATATAILLGTAATATAATAEGRAAL